MGEQHLEALKQQESMVKAGTDKSQAETTADSKLALNDEHVQVVAVKDKQIDLLSSMLAQKEVDLKNLKLS